MSTSKLLVSISINVACFACVARIYNAYTGQKLASISKLLARITFKVVCGCFQHACIFKVLIGRYCKCFYRLSSAKATADKLTNLCT